MLHYSVIFLVVALVAAIFGFGGIAAGAVEIAKNPIRHFRHHGRDHVCDQFTQKISHQSIQKPLGKP